MDNIPSGTFFETQCTLSQKWIPTLTIVTWRRIIIFFNNFFVRIFLTQMATQWPYKFPPHPSSVPALPEEIKTSEMLHFYSK